ncbi:DEKNAAC101245 [Brettanomyces naardenensis]|uniref:DEKNAAC101245 n=1 Tax=Brettanomyces naardenensis TaxID=13370 RepID=A0A448YHI1_BRENA|nr:DEKNAAC101245 [Brettanomyces naardenensis]
MAASQGIKIGSEPATIVAGDQSVEETITSKYMDFSKMPGTEMPNKKNEGEESVPRIRVAPETDYKMSSKMSSGVHRLFGRSVPKTVEPNDEPIITIHVKTEPADQNVGRAANGSRKNSKGVEERTTDKDSANEVKKNPDGAIGVKVNVDQENISIDGVQAPEPAATEIAGAPSATNTTFIETSAYRDIVNQLNDVNSPLFKLFALYQIATDDPRYPTQRIVQLRSVATQLFNSTYDQIDTKEYLSYLAGSMLGPDDSAFDRAVLRLFYMSRFRWNYDLLSALRLLCDRLFFKGESQNIDKILESFSQSWFEVYGICNGKSLYGSPNGVYLVAYSLIILNTDLHTKNHGPEKVKKISKSKFVKNTILALKQNRVAVSDFKDLEHALKRSYSNLASYELRLLVSDAELQIGAENAFRALSQRQKPSQLHHYLNPRPSLGSLFNRSDKDDYSLYSIANSDSSSERPSTGFGFAKAMRAQETLRKLDTSRSSIYSLGAGSTLTTGSTSASILTRFSSGLPGPIDPDESFLAGDRFGLDLNDPYFIEEDGDVELEMQGPPWVKEGLQKVVLTRAVLQSMKTPGSNVKGDANGIVMDSLSAINGLFKRSSARISGLNSGQRLPWKEYFTVVSEGQLRLFLFDQSASNLNGLQSKGDGNWTSFAKCLASVNLNSCFAQYVHPNSKLYSHIAKHMQKVPSRTGDETFWVLNLPLNDPETFKNYRRIVFLAGTSEVALEFCETCNFWAARTSSIPPEESISSIEYGWSDKMMSGLSESTSTRNSSFEDYLFSVNVQKWRPVVYGLIATDLSMIEQLRDLRRYYCELELKYRHHKELEVFQDRLDSLAGGMHHHGGSSLNGLFGRVRKTDNTAKNVSAIRKNYVNRLNYLSNGMLKYKCYIITLQRAIVFRRTRLAQLEQANNVIAEQEEEEDEEEVKEAEARRKRAIDKQGQVDSRKGSQGGLPEDSSETEKQETRRVESEKVKNVEEMQKEPQLDEPQGRQGQNLEQELQREEPHQAESPHDNSRATRKSEPLETFKDVPVKV